MTVDSVLRCRWQQGRAELSHLFVTTISWLSGHHGESPIRETLISWSVSLLSHGTAKTTASGLASGPFVHTERISPPVAAIDRPLSP